MTILAIDLAVLAVIAFCVWRGYRNGLIRGVFGIVALIVSLIVANIAAEAYSKEFAEMLKPFVGGIVDTALVKIVEEDVEYDLSEYEDESKDFETSYMALRYIGLPNSPAARVASLSTEEETPVGFFLSDIISDKLSAVLAHVAVFGIAFILIAIVFTVVGNLIGFVFSLPGLKAVDIIIGIICGFAKGLILVMALAAVVRYAGILAPDILEETMVLKYFVNTNIIASTLGI